MRRGIKIAVTVFACLFILTAVSVFSIPRLRVSLFVNMYHELIEEGLAAGHGVPADDAVILGYKAVNSWNTGHPMTEFVIVSRGNTYYGCYYSPHNVPLAFQNTDAVLTQNGHNHWEWRAEGDNHGNTSRILDRWYYFKASF